MPSLLHEGILELIRDQPELVAHLLRELLRVDVPAFSEARLADSTLSEPLPTEYRADAVVLFVGERPVFGCIVEAQLAEDTRKSFTWPLYAMSARARYECPFALVVVTPEESVASWASQRISLGAGQAWSPLVIGPGGIPVITDPVLAVAEPQLALLSALAHARADTEQALPVTRAALAAVASVPRDQQVLYFYLLRSAVGQAARKAFEMLPHRLEKYLTEEEREQRAALRRQAQEEGLSEGRREGLSEGRREGRREGLSEGLYAAIVTVLESRALSVPPDFETSVAKRSQAELSELLRRALSVASAEELMR